MTRRHIESEGEANEADGRNHSRSIVQRVVARRGAEHCFANLDPARTALVVIDLQHVFMNEAVGHAVVPAARDIVPAVNRLAAVVRETGGGVFWIKMDPRRALSRGLVGCLRAGDPGNARKAYRRARGKIPRA